MRKVSIALKGQNHLLAGSTSAIKFQLNDKTPHQSGICLFVCWHFICILISHVWDNSWLCTLWDYRLPYLFCKSDKCLLKRSCQHHKNLWHAVFRGFISRWSRIIFDVLGTWWTDVSLHSLWQDDSRSCNILQTCDTDYVWWLVQCDKDTAGTNHMGRFRGSAHSAYINKWVVSNGESLSVSSKFQSETFSHLQLKNLSTLLPFVQSILLSPSRNRLYEE